MGKRHREEAGRTNRVAVGYLRRSTDRQEQSIPDQRKAVERYATEQGLTVERWYTDDAISGTSVAGRKAFQELIADAQKPGCPFRFVVVYDVKRFGRGDNDEAGYHRQCSRLTASKSWMRPTVNGPSRRFHLYPAYP